MKKLLIALLLMPVLVVAQSITRFGGTPSIIGYSDSARHNSLYFYGLGYNDEIDFKFSNGKKKTLTNSERSFKLTCKQKGSSRYLCTGTGYDARMQCPIRVSASYYRFSLSKTNSLTYTIKGNCNNGYLYMVKLWVVGGSY